MDGIDRTETGRNEAEPAETREVQEVQTEDNSETGGESSEELQKETMDEGEQQGYDTDDTVEMDDEEENDEYGNTDYGFSGDDEVSEEEITSESPEDDSYGFDDSDDPDDHSFDDEDNLPENEDDLPEDEDDLPEDEEDLPEDEEDLPEEEDDFPEDEDDLPEEEDNLPENEDDLPEDEDDLPEEEDDFPEDEDDLPEEEDDLPEEEDDLPEEEDDLPEDEGDLPEDEDDLPEEEDDLPEEEDDLPEEEDDLPEEEDDLPEEEEDLPAEEDDLPEDEDDLPEDEEDLPEDEDDLPEDEEDLPEDEDDLPEEEDLPEDEEDLPEDEDEEDLPEDEDDLPEDEDDLPEEEDDDSADYQHKAENRDEQESPETEKTELDECLKNFEQTSWEQLTPEEQKEKTEQLAGIIADELKLENPPKVEYYYSERNGDYGGYAASTNTIYINEKYLGDAKETVDTIAHESRHCWQHECAENPETTEDQAFKDNFDNYIKPEQDYQGYLEQPVEQDARDYAAGIADRIPESGEIAESAADKPADERKQDPVEPMTTGPPESVENSKTLTPDQLPDDFESKYDARNEIEYQKLTPEAVRKTEAAGLSSEKVQELREIPHGEKPDPETYLSKEYIDQHLKKFEDSGCCKLIAREPTGTIGEGQDALFMISNDEKDRILKEATDPETGKVDVRKIEDSLGLDPGYLGNDPYIVQVDNPENLRMPTGNESNAWQEYWTPGGVTCSGVNEAVIDPVSEGNYSYKKLLNEDNTLNTDGSWNQ